MRTPSAEALRAPTSATIGAEAKPGSPSAQRNGGGSAIPASAGG
jgi:hypothetical protein